MLLASLAVLHVYAGSVEVQLQAPWPNTPAQAEYAEYLADKSTDLFVEFACGRAAPPQGALLDAALSLRYYAPRITAHLSLAQTVASSCPGADAIIVGDTVTCHRAGTPVDGFRGHADLLPHLDHIHPSSSLSSSSAHHIIAYVPVGTPVAKEVCQAAEAAWARGEELVLALRHYYPEGVQEGIPLAGYGVELALKSLEYKAVDDSHSVAAGQEDPVDAADGVNRDVHGLLLGTLMQRYPELKEELREFAGFIGKSGKRFEELQKWEISKLGLLAAQRVATSADPLAALSALAGNFPILAPGLTTLAVNESIKSSIEVNQHMLEGGQSLGIIQGQYIQTESVQPHKLYTLARDALFEQEALRALGVGRRGAKSLSTEDFHSEVTPRFDPRPPTGQEHVVPYLNDVEKDRRYQRFPREVSSVEHFRPSWMQQIPMLSRNLYTVVGVLDTTSLASIKAMAAVFGLSRQGVPVRFALCMVVPEAAMEAASPDAPVSAGVALARALYTVAEEVQEMGPSEFFNFVSLVLPQVMEAELASPSADDTITSIGAIRSAYQQMSDHIEEAYDEAPLPSFDMVIAGKAGVSDTTLVQARAHAERMGVTKSMPAFFVNGRLVQLGNEDADAAGQLVFREIYQSVNDVKVALRRGYLSDATSDIHDALLTPTAGQPVFRRNCPYAAPSKLRPLSFVPMAYVPNTLGYKAQQLLSARYMMNADGEFDVKPYSVIVACDFAVSECRVTAQSAITRAIESKAVRVALVHMGATDNLLARVMEAASQAFPRSPAKQLHVAQQLMQVASVPTSIITLLHDTLEISANNADKIAAALDNIVTIDDTAAQWLRAQRLLASEMSVASTIEHLSSAVIIVVNGRLIELDEGDSLDADAFQVIEGFESRFAGVLKLVSGDEPDVRLDQLPVDEQTVGRLSDVVAAAVSMGGARVAGGMHRQSLHPSIRNHANFRTMTPADTSDPDDVCALEVQLVLDPLSRSAQRVAPMIAALAKSVDMCVSIVLNPKAEIDSLPLKSFYRYVFPSSARVSEETGAIEAPDARAVFDQLPEDRLLTLGLDAHDAWQAYAVDAKHDLDNIRLADYTGEDKHVKARFGLESLAVEGNCLDYSADGEPPRGLQLELVSQDDTRVADTIVMSNLGYFQLRTRPGVYSIKLAPGMSSELYSIGTSPTKDVREVEQVAVVSFDGASVRLPVSRRIGRESESLLGELTEAEKAHEAERKTEQERMAEAMARMMGKAVPEPPPPPAPKPPAMRKLATGPDGTPLDRSNETIHVFSVATGHLYERFMKVMMLSAVTSSSRPVKFWILANYVSPKFKDAVPALAKKFGFEVEFVTYKWPSWLNKQTEKQRIIWAYKVLFLDVLFPLALDRIIFLDADLTVRGDLAELADLDLEGAPYAFTPFCQDDWRREETAGYRFWESGWWKEHLAGKPYHISALYVVDLHVFRRSGAGDRMRATYNALSQDPNSLANLDQDIGPSVGLPIYSLSQEWLYCESWCVDGKKSEAKAIDLCNNPMSKEPKLDMARRIVDEWSDYDEAIRRAEEEFLLQGHDATTPAPTAARDGSHDEL